jgi:hypothetical protein
MRKFIISALAAASVLTAAAAANAGVYFPTCGWVFNGWGWSYICG